MRADVSHGNSSRKHPWKDTYRGAPPAGKAVGLLSLKSSGRLTAYQHTGDQQRYTLTKDRTRWAVRPQGTKVPDWVNDA